MQCILPGTKIQIEVSPVPTNPFPATESEISTESDDDLVNETLVDRLYALRDMVPPNTRNWLYHSSTTTVSTVRKGVWWAGRAFWATTATVLLVTVPFMILQMDDMQQTAMEQEMRMREMGAEVLTGSGTEPSTADRVGAALEAERSLTEPKSAL
jgi:mitochondrial import receptor subunit TOM22